MQATPLLRKMKIATSSEHERFGADAIHYKIQDAKNIIILGEAKTYSSNYKFATAFSDACLLYTSDAADEEDSGDFGGCRNI